MYCVIHVKDPNDERNQLFALLKTGPLLKSNEGKKWHQWYVDTTGNQVYKMMSDEIRIEGMGIFAIDPASNVEENESNNFG